ncbi:hypothetical protein [Streptomyces meridianus]|uniref:NlpC/P60 domain-containing protein n=1 Tax=Streptomyces meridianus TaxID=2938945 RepID=A0ABT0XC27_9ACTN|nr:hypothetical protein [Streptomyces meridianus]MCM2579287.1 hypothetical protein [Streptomyces meridianus]
MAKEEFGFRLGELEELERDWKAVGKRVAEMSGKLGEVRETVAQAVTIDLATSGLAGVVGGLGTAFQVLQDVKDIKARMDGLAEIKDKLAEGLADDGRKLKAVVDAYTEAERKARDDLDKGGKDDDIPAPPRHGGSGGGGASSGGGAGGGGGSGSGDYGGRGDGKWQTEGDWDAWSPGRTHPRTGAGVIAEPDLSAVSGERREILDRAMERVEHRIGYSQSAFTNDYRDDCSGLVSAAWGLEPPGLNTWGLMESDVAQPITKDDLQPGDALIAGDHTVVFGGWADEAHTKYIGIESNGSQGHVSQVIPYPYFPRDVAHEQSIGAPYKPFRRNDL